MTVRTRRPSRWAVATATSVVALSAMALSAMALGAGAAESAAKSPTGRIRINDFSFHPAKLHVKAGARIRVTNGDDTTHTFTADKGGFDSGDLSGGKSATVTVKRPGTYRYHCEIHDYMTGTLTAS